MWEQDVQKGNFNTFDFYFKYIHFNLYFKYLNLRFHLSRCVVSSSLRTWQTLYVSLLMFIHDTRMMTTSLSLRISSLRTWPGYHSVLFVCFITDVHHLGPGHNIWFIARYGPHDGDYMYHCVSNGVHTLERNALQCFLVKTLASYYSIAAMAHKALVCIHVLEVQVTVQCGCKTAGAAGMLRAHSIASWSANTCTLWHHRDGFHLYYQHTA